MASNSPKSIFPFQSIRQIRVEIVSIYTLHRRVPVSLTCHVFPDSASNLIREIRRPAEFITPIPKPKKKKASRQKELDLSDDEDFVVDAQQYAHTQLINELRRLVDDWRTWPDPNSWKVTPETARLLNYWRHHDFQGVRPFFCQVEAVETAIWLTEVAPKIGKQGDRFLDHLKQSNLDANPQLFRLALKLATGAGKTTVMAMLIAWQTINAVRRPGTSKFTRGFLIVAPGITIRVPAQSVRQKLPVFVPIFLHDLVAGES